MVATHHTHHNLVGLARVSTVVQDAQLQRDALTEAGCSLGAAAALFFTAGPRGEQDGVFGRVHAG